MRAFGSVTYCDVRLYLFEQQSEANRDKKIGSCLSIGGQEPYINKILPAETVNLCPLVRTFSLTWPGLPVQSTPFSHR